MVIAIAGACLAVDRPARSVRLALGSVAPTIVRAADGRGPRRADRRLGARRRVASATPLRFGQLAAEASRPIDDHRSTAAYRRRAVDVLARRLLRRAFPGATHERVGDGEPAHAEPRSVGRASDERALPPARQRRRRMEVADAWVGESLLYVLRERLGLIGRQGGVRAGRVRLLQRARRRRAGLLVPRARRQRRRSADRHGRGAGRAWRADRRPAGVRRRRRRAVRLLHPRPDHGRARAARAPSRPDGHRDPRGAVREHLPLHRLRTDHRGGAAGGGRSGPARRDAHRPADPRADAGAGRIGDSPPRPDGILKAQGSFAFSSDLPIDGAVWGATLRSPHPYARIVSIDVTPAWRIDGVEAVITAADVPGKATYGLIASDQPVFAGDHVRYVGEPIAAVAADHPETCRRALAAIEVDVRGARTAARSRGGDRRRAPADPPRRQRAAPPAHPARRSSTPSATWSSRARTRSACRTRPSSGSRRRSPCPTPTARRRAARRHAVAARGPQADRRLPRAGRGTGAAGARRRRRRVRRPRGHQPAGPHLPARPAPGAPGAHGLQPGRELPRPRPPPPGAASGCATTPPRDGELVKIEARFVLDGGAYASTSSAVLLNAITHTQGPYRCPNAVVDGYAARTNHLPCGAMRGFGVVQACFAHESQMDLLAAACGLDPLEIRLRNAMVTGDNLITGQVVESVAPVARCIRETAALPMPTTPIGTPPTRATVRRDAPAGRRRADRRRRRRAPWYRLGRGDQEPDVLGGLRRLLDGALPASPTGWRRSSSPRRRSARAS